jgi:hypothetical protein
MPTHSIRHREQVAVAAFGRKGGHGLDENRILVRRSSGWQGGAPNGQAEVYGYEAQGVAPGNVGRIAATRAASRTSAPTLDIISPDIEMSHFGAGELLW